ncbi:MAG: PHP domain-containing protein [Candidatus Omnitrophica bacterium]|nr:PHP domain-containing protein [Candidatus Omnitrophota bacterium]
MKISFDFHLHSRHSCDTRKGSLEELANLAAASGITQLGFSDHLHTPYNLPDLASSRQEYLSLPSFSSLKLYFGCELSCVSQWELAEIAAGKVKDPVYGIREGGPPGGQMALGLGEEEIKQLGLQYIIGGVHWMLYEPLTPEQAIRSYHRQYLFLACHPLVDIIAHPWWWQGAWMDSDHCYRSYPWFDNFRRIPISLHQEFIMAVKENRKKVEVNISAMLLNPRYPESFKRQYLEYLSFLRQQAVFLTIGSDFHGFYNPLAIERASKILEGAGFKGEDFWQLEFVGLDKNNGLS